MSTSRYQVDRVIGRGGMAEVFKARMTIDHGIERAVALKRVHPSLTKDPAWVAMFLDEARLSTMLTHANIVQVFDVGQSKEGYFLVMEYIEGPSLAQVLDRGGGAPGRLPLRLAAHLVIEVCKALSYAHERVDHEGRPLGIIHRDVSPANVMLSRDGEVKLADFGLAKAATQITRTAPGIIKGKVGYFAPESLHTGVTLDHRADVFAAGIVLWEMLAGRRLFSAESDVETLMKIKACKIPSVREANPDVPEDFEPILMRALAADREARFPDARALGEALAEFLCDFRLLVTSWDVADLVRAARAPSLPPPPPRA